MLQNKKLAQARFKKNFREWKYLKEHEKDVEDLLSIYEEDFSSVITQLHQYFADKAPEESHEDVAESGFSVSNEEIILPSSKNIDSPGWVKKLYKKIAIETHPDKLAKMEISEIERLRREDIFKRSAECLQEGDFDTILNFAYDLDIEVDVNSEEEAEVIKNSIVKLKGKINEMKELVAWTWGELAGNKIERTSLIVWAWEEMGLQKIPANVIEDYISAHEANDISSWKKMHLAKVKNKKPPARIPGTRPGRAESRKRRESN
jgi:hypothetical protein